MSRHWASSTTTQMAKIMVRYGRSSRSYWAKSVRSSFSRTIMGKAIRESSIRTRLGTVPNWECFFVNRARGLFLSVNVDNIKLAGKKQNIDPMWKIQMKDVDFEEPTSFFDNVYLGCNQRLSDKQRYCRQLLEHVGIQNLCWSYRKLPSTGKLDANIFSWSYDMEGHVKKCVERDCELANTKQLNSYTKSQHHALTTTNSRKKIVKSLLTECSEMPVFGPHW